MEIDRYVVPESRIVQTPNTRADVDVYFDNRAVVLALINFLSYLRNVVRGQILTPDTYEQY